MSTAATVATFRSIRSLPSGGLSASVVLSHSLPNLQQVSQLRVTRSIARAQRAKLGMLSLGVAVDCGGLCWIAWVCGCGLPAAARATFRSGKRLDAETPGKLQSQGIPCAEPRKVRAIAGLSPDGWVIGI